MSVTKNKSTIYHETDQDVKFKLNWLRLDNINNPQNLKVRGGLIGKVGTAEGVVDTKEAVITLADVQEHCTATEKTKLRNAIAIFERELARAEAELAGETHDGTDVFTI